MKRSPQGTPSEDDYGEIDMAVTVAGFGVLFFLGQVGWFLWSGEWRTFSINDVGDYLFGPDSWFASPASWLGVHKSLSHVGLAFAAIMLGLSIPTIYEWFTGWTGQIRRGQESKRRKALGYDE